MCQSNQASSEQANRPTSEIDQKQLDADILQRSKEARSTFYMLISSFRKYASEVEDKHAETMFNFAAEIIAGLSRAFRDFEGDRTVE